MCPSILLAVLGMQLSTRPIAPRTAPMARACVPRCSASPEDASPNGDDAISFAALMREAQRRTGGTLGMHDRMLKEGPGGLTPSSAVVEHVLTQVAAGNVSQAFRFTCRSNNVPPGVHKSSTDWSKRMNWEKCRVIQGACTGKAETESTFEEMVRQRFPSMLATEGYRFVGEPPAWESNRVVEHVVEVQTRDAEQLLYRFRLVYDPLLHCHLVAAVSTMAMSTAKFFPGADDGEAPLADI